MYMYFVDALKLSEVADGLELHKLTNTKWHINGACATTGEGLHESLDVLADLVKYSRQS